MIQAGYVLPEYNTLDKKTLGLLCKHKRLPTNVDKKNQSKTFLACESSEIALALNELEPTLYVLDTWDRSTLEVYAKHFLPIGHKMREEVIKNQVVISYEIPEKLK